MGHGEAVLQRHGAVVAPLVNPHLLAHEGDPRGWTIMDVLPPDKAIHGNGCLVPMSDGGDDVFRPESRIAAEEHSGVRALEGHGVDDGHVPFPEFEPDIPLDPGKGVVLTDGDDHVVGFKEHLFPRGDELPLSPVAVNHIHHGKAHARQLPVLVNEFLGHVVVDDGDILGNSVVDLPGRGLHLGALGAHHHLHVLAPQAPGRPATVHSRITAPEHEDPAADLAQVLKGDGREPVNANVDVLVGLFSPGDR